MATKEYDLTDDDFSMHSKFLHLLRYESLVFEDIVFYWL